MTELATRQPPAPLPVPGEKPKTLLERVQAMFPKFVPGKRVEVDPYLIEVREYAKYAIEQWEAQLAIANYRLQLQMEDAEFGTVGGVVVINRLQHPVKGYWVNGRDNDYLKGKKH